MKIGGLTAARDVPGSRRALLVLAHGAGGDLDDPLLRGLGGALAPEGIETVRFNLPYRDAGRRAPGAQSASEDGYRHLVEAVRQDGVPLFIGGKSYGGRIATHISASGTSVDGLVLLSYPLHPPGRPERLRTAHLPDVPAPMLFVQGTRDPFATPDLLADALARLPRARLVQVRDGDHSLRVRARAATDVVSEIASEVARFLASG